MSEKFSARECALIAAKAADEHKATDIMVLEVGQLVDVTEYFVIMSVRSWKRWKMRCASNAV